MKTLTIARSLNEEEITFLVDEKRVASASKEQYGWSGLDDVLNAIEGVAIALGVTIEYVELSE